MHIQKNYFIYYSDIYVFRTIWFLANDIEQIMQGSIVHGLDSHETIVVVFWTLAEETGMFRCCHGRQGDHGEQCHHKEDDVSCV